MSATTEQEHRRHDEPEAELVVRDLEPLDDEADDVKGGVTGGGCPSWMCGSGGNHNETLATTPEREDDADVVLRDLEPLEDEADDVKGGVTGGGCPSWMCGSGGNHNETLATTPEREDDADVVLRDLEPLEDEADDVKGGVTGGGCPTWACGSDGNHNETQAVTPDRDEADDVALRDPDLSDESAEKVEGGIGGAGCPTWACGTSGNHNEALAVTA